MWDNNKNVDYLRLSRLEIAHVLDRANELQNGNEWDLVELLSYLYIQTNISEMYHMEERINVFFTCRLNTDVSKSYTVEKELCVDTMIQSELLSLKSYQVESRVNEKIEDRYVRENPLNQFIEQIH